MSKRRVAVLTMHGGNPKLMLSGVADGVIHIVRCESLERNARKLNETLPSRLEKLRQNGSIVVVDEPIPNFYKYGRAVRLDSESPSGKPVLVEALQAYESLMGLKAITFPEKSGGAFRISDDLYEESRGNDGKAAYRINWPEIKPEVVALLLTVYVSTQQSMSDTTNFNAFLSELGVKEEPPMGLNSFMNIIKSTNERLLSPDALRGEHE